ncbi:MAG: CoA transferase, partial [Gammaproteobacteria bacterium]|nr:CoA transferase [Gammaproteobacteria bacterium]
GPFCGMLLGDMGAEVIRVDRPGPDPLQAIDPLRRNRRSIALNLKHEAGVQVLLRLADKSDALIEGFRPGVTERLGIGPDVCRQRNPRLVYGRVTGWGQDGPLATAAGHDLNYLALSGALHAFGPKGEPPVPPLNLLGDFGGGGMLLAFGLVCALLEAKNSGRGQVVDAAMLDGVNALMAMFHGFRAAGIFDEQPGTHFLSGAAHFYSTYETRDGKFIAVAAIEPAFYRQLIRLAGLDAERFGNQGFDAFHPDNPEWPRLKAELAGVFRTRTRDEWCALLEGTDACVAPVLTVSEASEHPHNVARRAFVTVNGVLQNAPAPRFSGTVPAAPRAPVAVGADSRAILEETGFASRDIDELLAAGTVVQS